MRYSQSDPIGIRGGPNLYQYSKANPLRFSDLYGRFSEDQIKKSCRCDGGLDAAAIAKEVDEKCMELSFITDPQLRKCIKERCDGTGRIKCKEKGGCVSEPDLITWGYNPQRDIAGSTVWRSNTAILCKNNATPGGTFPGHTDAASGDSVTIGNVVIHEWAHSCGWMGGGGGVPLDRGPE